MVNAPVKKMHDTPSAIEHRLPDIYTFHDLQLLCGRGKKLNVRASKNGRGYKASPTSTTERVESGPHSKHSMPHWGSAPT